VERLFRYPASDHKEHAGAGSALMNKVLGVGHSN
jgi:hypothetical protein